MASPRWLNTKDVAKLLSVSSVTVRRWTNSGILDCSKTEGGHRRYWSQDIETFLSGMIELDTKSNLAVSTSTREEPIYNRVNMANMLLRLNMSTSEAIVAVESELDRVSCLLASTEEVNKVAESLPVDQQKVLRQHVTKVISGLQYHDLFTQRICSLRSILNSTNTVLKLSLSDLSKTQRKMFSDEIERTNSMIDSAVITNYINILLRNEELSVDVFKGISEVRDSPLELF